MEVIFRIVVDNSEQIDVTTMSVTPMMMVYDGGNNGDVLVRVMNGLVMTMAWVVVGMMEEVVEVHEMRRTGVKVMVVMEIMKYMSRVMFDDDKDGVTAVMTEMKS